MFQHLPVEIIVQIAEYLLSKRDLHFFALASTRLHSLVTPVLFKEYCNFALYWASKSGKTQTASIALEYVKERKDECYGEALFQAAEKGHLEIAALLLDKGADPNWAGYYERKTPLIQASFLGHPATVEVLLERGANCETRERSSFTPLILAAMAGHVEIIDILLDRGANIGETCSWRGTALHWAATARQQAAFDKLIQRGADPSLGGLLAGKTAYEIAESQDLELKWLEKDNHV
jgi:ankyrin repeat protein